MPTIITNNYIPEVIRAEVICDDGMTAGLYFKHGGYSDNIGLVGIPSSVAVATARAFNAATGAHCLATAINTGDSERVVA